MGTVDSVTGNPLTIEERLKGTGQLSALETNPNLKGLDVQEIVKMTPEEIEYRVATGEMTKEQQHTIMKHLGTRTSKDLRDGK